MKTAILATVGLTVSLTAPVLAEWPQWRGADRSGNSESPALALAWDDDKPPLLWEAKILPREGGEGSPVIANGAVFVFANEPRDLAATVRTLDDRFYQSLQWFDPSRVPEDTLARIEKARLAVPADLKGNEKREWIVKWSEDNITIKNHQRLAQRRLTRGGAAVSPKGMSMLKSVRGRTFGTESIFLNWLDDNEVSDEDRELILDALPDTVREAKDVIFCVDFATGEPRWDTVLPGRPESRIGSSTPTVRDGRLHVFGTTHAHCLDANSGKVIWSTELPSPASASSPLVTEGLVVGLAGHLVAFDRTTGKIAWQNETLKGRKSSPMSWRGKLLVHAESSKKLACVDPKDGSLLWEVPAGGDSTPAVSDDVAVVHVKTGVRAYGLYEDRAESLWHHELEDTRGASSPIARDGRVFVYPTEGAVALDLLTGKVQWEEGFKSGIISPLLADGKLLNLTNGGNFLSFHDPKTGDDLGKVRMKGSRCASPALADGRLVVRTRDSLACFDLRKK